MNNLEEWARQQVISMPYEDSLLLVETAYDWNLTKDHIKALINVLKPEDRDRFNKQYGYENI